MKKQYIYIFIIVLAVMVFGFFVFNFLEGPKDLQDKGAFSKKLKIIQNTGEETDRIREKGLHVHVDDIFQVEKKLAEEEKNKILEQEIRAQLEDRIRVIFQDSKDIKTKKNIQKKFETMQYKDAFLADLDGNTFYGKNNAKDMDARSITLEQIQKVGRYGHGLIVSRVDNEGTKRYIFVKSLGFSRLFIGVDTYFPKPL